MWFANAGFDRMISIYPYKINKCKYHLLAVSKSKLKYFLLRNNLFTVESLKICQK